jgi:hypothetical protein
LQSLLQSLFSLPSIVSKPNIQSSNGAHRYIHYRNQYLQ